MLLRVVLVVVVAVVYRSTWKAVVVEGHNIAGNSTAVEAHVSTCEKLTAL